jgi:hypothetical protein
MVFASVNLHFFQRNSTWFHQGARDILDRLHDVLRGIEVLIGGTLGPSVENVVQPRLDKNMDFFNGKCWKNDGKTSGKKIMVKKNGGTRQIGILTVLPTCFVDVEFSHTGQILPNESANNMRSPTLTPMADLQQTQMGNSQRETVFHGENHYFWALNLRFAE